MSRQPIDGKLKPFQFTLAKLLGVICFAAVLFSHDQVRRHPLPWLVGGAAFVVAWWLEQAERKHRSEPSGDWYAAHVAWRIFRVAAAAAEGLQLGLLPAAVIGLFGGLTGFGLSLAAAAVIGGMRGLTASYAESPPGDTAS